MSGISFSDAVLLAFSNWRLKCFANSLIQRTSKEGEHFMIFDAFLMPTLLRYKSKKCSLSAYVNLRTLSLKERLHSLQI